MCVLLYQYCQLFLFPILNSILLFKRARKRTYQENKHGLWLLQHFHPLTFNMQLYMIGFPFALKVILLAKAKELASEKSLLRSGLPTSLPSKAKNHSVLHKGHPQRLRVACLLHLFALYVLPGGWAWPSIPLLVWSFCLTDKAAWLTPAIVHTKMNRHETTPERCLCPTFPTRGGKEWSYSCPNSRLKMWPQCVWKYDHSLSLI